jgi:uncharacterized protein YggE
MPPSARVTLAPFALAAVLGLAACKPAAAPAVAGNATLVSVSAHAEVRKAPDVAVVSTGITSLAADANTAIRRNAEQMQLLMAALKAAGIAEKDVQTSGVSLNPDYQYVAGRPPRIKGYYASNTVNVTVREIGALGGLLDAVVAAGANQINGPSFDIADKDAVLDEARGLALAKARTRADGYARRLGLRVLRVVSVDETGGRAAPMLHAMRGMAVAEQAATDAAANAPIAPGENVLGLNLDVVYELGK